MIEINLLPEELRNKVAKAKKPETVVKNPVEGLEPKHAVLLVPVIAIILICAQLFIGIAVLVKGGQLRSLNAKLQSLATQKKGLDEFNAEYNLVSQDSQAIQKLMRERVVWSEKLNKLSLNLPSGIWFSGISVNSKGMVLQGAVVSLNKDDLNLINKLIDSLKIDPVFFKDFSSLDMGSAEKKTVGIYDITDFNLNAPLKGR